ncbi:MAG: AAA family ATPase [Actinomycetota bacterium]|nr:AAA family ATPase [Actinomycetota bacterium]
MICQNCKRRPATMAADLVINGDLMTLKLCGLCAHRIQMRQSWDEKGLGLPSRGVHVTQDLNLPFPRGTEAVVFTAITKRGQQVMEWAERESHNFGLDDIASTAVLISVLSEEKSASYNILREMGINLDAAFKAMHEALKSGAEDFSGSEPLTPRVLLSKAQEKAASFDDKAVEPEHIMLALLDSDKSLALEILLRLGVNIKELKARLLYYLECRRMEMNMARPTSLFRQMSPLEQALSGTPEDASILNFFSRDLVGEAREKMLDLTAGRDNLIERIIRVLCRHRRNNPLLVGETGVGKAYLVEALAHKVSCGDVPDQLKDVRIAELDAVALAEGSEVRGELEKRINRLVKEMASYSSGFILFIPYVHTVLGEESKISGVSLTPILQPILDCSRVWIIATTTYRNYDNLIPRDENLATFFQRITVDEMPPDGTRQLLEALQPHYESFHKVRISDGALEAAINLSDRYLTDLYLPDKAIDLIDETSAHVAVIGDGMEVKEVTRENVAEIVTMATGIPVNRLLNEEADRLIHMEEMLARRVIGQDGALQVVAETIRRSRAGLSDSKHPMGSFLFMGPTGVGKTEVARSLAEFLFGDERAMIRLDMSEYAEKHSLARLIGSPPGYIGYEEGGQLTSAVDKKPYSVVLLDEIEKAHPSIFNLLLQLLDEGRLTDSHGKTVNFSNAIIIMTSNIASGIIDDIVAADGTEADDLDLDRENLILEEVKSHFSMEFINRIDEIVVFDHLSPEVIERIVDLKVGSIIKRLEQKGTKLLLDETAKVLLARHGYSSDFGARFLQRVMLKELSNPLSDFLLKGELERGETVEVVAEGDALSFKVFDTPDE